MCLSHSTSTAPPHKPLFVHTALDFTSRSPLLDHFIIIFNHGPCSTNQLSFPQSRDPNQRHHLMQVFVTLVSRYLLVTVIVFERYQVRSYCFHPISQSLIAFSIKHDTKVIPKSGEASIHPYKWLYHPNCIDLENHSTFYCFITPSMFQATHFLYQETHSSNMPNLTAPLECLVSI